MVSCLCFSNSSPVSAKISPQQNSLNQKISIALLIIGILGLIFSFLYLYQPEIFGKNLTSIEEVGYPTLFGSLIAIAIGSTLRCTAAPRTKKRIPHSQHKPSATQIDQPKATSITEKKEIVLKKCQYVLETNGQHFSSNVNKKKVMRVFYKNQPNAYKEALRELIDKNSRCELLVKCESLPKIAVPSFDALQLLTKKLSQEHGIHLEVISELNLNTKLLQLARSDSPLGGGSYFGCIVTQFNDSSRHVSSCIVHYRSSIPEQQGVKYSFEILYIDTAENTSSRLFLSIKKVCNIPKSAPFSHVFQKFFVYAKEHQADMWSCRTGALTLLTRALKDLKGKNQPFSELLELDSPNGTKVIRLPEGWLTKEQIYKPLTDAETRERAQDTENVTFECALTIKFDKSIASTQAQAQLLAVDSTRPEEVLQDIDSTSMFVVFKVTMPCNTFLVKESHRNADCALDL